MMTDKERLAIAEEIASAALPEEVVLKDVKAMRHTDGISWTVYRNVGAPSFLEQGIGLVDLVFRARQKLAAEREASRTPEERRLMAELERLKKALDDIAMYGGYSRTGSCCADVARKALEQGA